MKQRYEVYSYRCVDDAQLPRVATVKQTAKLATLPKAQDDDTLRRFAASVTSTDAMALAQTSNPESVELSATSRRLDLPAPVVADATELNHQCHSSSRIMKFVFAALIRKVRGCNFQGGGEIDAFRIRQVLKISKRIGDRGRPLRVGHRNSASTA